MHSQEEVESISATTFDQIMIVGPLPPPANGVTIMTEVILTVQPPAGAAVQHFDTSDHRCISTIGVFDLTNIWLAISHWSQFAWALFRIRPRIVHLPLARNRLGFLRDALFVLSARL